MANEFVLGALSMACAVAGLFFLRFFRSTRDRLFAIFAIAFWLLGVNWLWLAAVGREEDRTASLYVLRVLAFLLILYGIIEKNRAARPP